MVNRKFLGVEGATALRNWIRGELAANTPYDQFAREDPHRQRLDEGKPGRLLFQNPAHARSADGEHDAPVPRHALQLQQVPRPSLRALDAGPVLPPGGLLRPSRSHRKIRPAATDDRRLGRRSGPAAVRNHRRRRQRRSEARSHRRRQSARRSRSRQTSEPRRASRAAKNSPIGSPRPTTRTSPRATSTACGATSPAAASSNRSTTSAPATRRPIPSCSTISPANSSRAASTRAT